MISDAMTPHIGLGDRLLARGHFAAAAESYRRVLRSCPGHADTRIKLAHALKLAKDYVAAAAILDALAADYPDNPAVMKECGRLSFAQHRFDEALDRFRDVIRLNPGDADAHHWLANLEILKDNPAVAREHYRRSIALKPLMRVPAIKPVPDFSVLFLFSPGNANTPPDTLVEQAPYESCFLLMLPEIEYDHRSLRQAAHLVVNLISDVDQGRDVLLLAAALADRIGLPVINHPGAVLKTDRQSVAETLSGIPFCCVPPTVRLACDHAPISPGHWPKLIRVAGTHGGEDLEKVDSVAAISDFTRRFPNADFYLTDFIDYQSADGFFRKYRFFCVGDEILPYHLAIHDSWKVHHYATDMENRPWMRHEEAEFLNDPRQFFDARNFAALQAIRQKIGLEFFGIDCAIGRDGNLIVFEVNASMLVHRDGGAFAYKAPAVDRIKHAFDAMLAGDVGQRRGQGLLGKCR